MSSVVMILFPPGPGTGTELFCELGSTRGRFHIGIFSYMRKTKGRQEVLSPSDISNDERPTGKGEFSVVTQGERSGPVGRIAVEDKPESRQRNLFLSLFPRNPLSGPHQKTGR